MHPHLDNAPITEALIDLRVVTPMDGLETLETFHDVVRARFPERRKLMAMNVQLPTDGAASVPPTSEVVGYQLWSADKRRVAQARKDGFSYSQLKPYDRWEHLVSEARAAWEDFRLSTGTANVSRVAVRTINRIELPIRAVFEHQFEGFFRTFPRISPSLSQTVGGLFMRLVLPQDAERCLVVLTEVLETPIAKADVLPFILDVDVFSEEGLPAEGDGIWTRLETLRKVKNDVFFSCLTDRALELFK